MEKPPAQSCVPIDPHKIWNNCHQHQNMTTSSCSMLNPSTLGVVRARSRSRSRTRIGYPNPQERPCMCLLNIKDTYLQFCLHLSNVFCYLTAHVEHDPSWIIILLLQNGYISVPLLTWCISGRGGWPCDNRGICWAGEKNCWSWDSQSCPHPPTEERPAGEKKILTIWLIFRSGSSRWEDQTTRAKRRCSSGPDVGKFTLDTETPITIYFHFPECPKSGLQIVFFFFTLYFSKKEKKDVEDLEVPETKRLFMEQNTLDAKKSKEQKEYLDALNKEVIWERSNLRCRSAMIRHNTDLLGSIDEHLPDEDVRKHLLELNEDLHDEKREALAVFNNKVETHRRNLHAVATKDWDVGTSASSACSICEPCIFAVFSNIVQNLLNSKWYFLWRIFHCSFSSWFPV